MATVEETKVVLITGSSSGIGEATAKLFSQNGFNVVVTGSRKEKVDRVVGACAELSPAKLKPLGLVADLSNPDNAEMLVRKTLEHFGRLDVLVNNAGIFTQNTPELTNDFESYRRVMTINVDSTVRASFAAIEALKKTKGNMVFVSSVSSTKPSSKGLSYAASKAAMSMVAKSLSIELAPDVRVNIVSPGPVVTPIFKTIGLSEDQARVMLASTTLQQRVGESEEIAKTIYFLAAGGGTFFTGSELFVDGGYLLKPSTHAVASVVRGAREK